MLFTYEPSISGVWPDLTLSLCGLVVERRSVKRFDSSLGLRSFFASYAQVTLASRLINIPLICPTHVGFFVVKLFSTRNKFCSRDISVLMQVSLNLIMSTLCPITDRKWHFPFNYLSVMLTPLITALLLPFGEPTYYQWDLNNFGMVLIQ